MSLLNALLPLPDGMEIKSVEYLTAENIPNNPAKKYSIVDVKCTDNYNRHFIVEMQSYWTQEFFSRTVFNVTSVYASQLGKGVSFQELKDVYALSLVNEEAFCYDKDEEYIQEFYLINKKHTDDIRTNLALIFVELPKFKPENKGDKYWLDISTEKSAILGAEKRGLAAGIEQGRAEGARAQAIESARLMKQHGDDINYIAAITHLPISEIEALCNS